MAVSSQYSLIPYEGAWQFPKPRQDGYPRPLTPQEMARRPHTSANARHPRSAHALYIYSTRLTVEAHAPAATGSVVDIYV